MSDPKTPAEILDALGKPFPKNAIKKRAGGGGKMYDYVETHSVINRLNAATNGEWSFHVRNVEWRADTLIAHGELTIPGLGTRTGFGVQKVAANSGEDLVKGASSDALKKAATLFGVALDLYGPDYEDMPQPAPRAPQTPRNAPQPANTAPASNTTHDAAWSAANTALHVAAQPRLVTQGDIDTFFHEKGITAVTTEHLVKLTNLIEGKADKQAVDAFQAWLGKRRAQQAALMPTPDEVPNPDKYTR